MPAQPTRQLVLSAVIGAALASPVAAQDKDGKKTPPDLATIATQLEQIQKDVKSLQEFRKTTDDLILAGLAGRASESGHKLAVVNAPFTDEPYGVGIRKGDEDGCEAVNKAITGMYQDGTAARLLKRWFGTSGLKITTTVPQFEGCV